LRLAVYFKREDERLLQLFWPDILKLLGPIDNLEGIEPRLMSLVCDTYYEHRKNHTLDEFLGFDELL